ncbi:hypothetical protein H632_c5200p0, partial [Helicosporidium sp. ATCC 50920]
RRRGGRRRRGLGDAAVSAGRVWLAAAELGVDGRAPAPLGQRATRRAGAVRAGLGAGRLGADAALRAGHFPLLARRGQGAAGLLEGRARLLRGPHRGALRLPGPRPPGLPALGPRYGPDARAPGPPHLSGPLHPHPARVPRHAGALPRAGGAAAASRRCAGGGERRRGRHGRGKEPLQRRKSVPQVASRRPRGGLGLGPQPQL